MSEEKKKKDKDKDSDSNSKSETVKPYGAIPGSEVKYKKTPGKEEYTSTFGTGDKPADSSLDERVNSYMAKQDGTEDKKGGLSKGDKLRSILPFASMVSKNVPNTLDAGSEPVNGSPKKGYGAAAEQFMASERIPTPDAARTASWQAADIRQPLKGINIGADPDARVVETKVIPPRPPDQAPVVTAPPATAPVAATPAPVAATPSVAAITVPDTPEQRERKEGLAIRDNLLKQGYGLVGADPTGKMRAYSPENISPTGAPPDFAKTTVSYDEKGRKVSSVIVSVPQLYPGGTEKWQQDVQDANARADYRATMDRSLEARNKAMSEIDNATKEIMKLKAPRSEEIPGLQAQANSILSDSRSYNVDKNGNKTLSSGAASIVANIQSAISHVSSANVQAAANLNKDISDGLSRVAQSWQNVIANDVTANANSQARMIASLDRRASDKATLEVRRDIAAATEAGHALARAETARVHTLNAQNQTRDDLQKSLDHFENVNKSLGTVYGLDGKGQYKQDYAMWMRWTSGYPESSMPKEYLPVLAEVKRRFQGYVEQTFKKRVNELTPEEQAKAKVGFEATMRGL